MSPALGLGGHGALGDGLGDARVHPGLVARRAEHVAVQLEPPLRARRAFVDAPLHDLVHAQRQRRLKRRLDERLARVQAPERPQHLLEVVCVGIVDVALLGQRHARVPQPRRHDWVDAPPRLGQRAVQVRLQRLVQVDAHVVRQRPGRVVRANVAVVVLVVPAAVALDEVPLLQNGRALLLRLGHRPDDVVLALLSLPREFRVRAPPGLVLLLVERPVRQAARVQCRRAHQHQVLKLEQRV
mmetsp:Transcript_29983/g.105438  ORF Transcript_29983/g.105438 Transcript_29983/m.105438 type:complete len:241 (-) Transcript_29983:259-981(-)